MRLSVNNNSPTINNINETVCNNYVLNGYYYDSTGIYTQTLINKDGCDSIIVLNLVVNEPMDTTITANSCEGDSYLFNGNTY